MPNYRSRLSPTDRWNVINYLRTLAKEITKNEEIHRYFLAAIIQAALLADGVSSTLTPRMTATDGYVTRKEYEELKAQMLAMKKELDALKKEREDVQSKATSKVMLSAEAIKRSLRRKVPKASRRGHAQASRHGSPAAARRSGRITARDNEIPPRWLGRRDVRAAQRPGVHVFGFF